MTLLRRVPTQGENTKREDQDEEHDEIKLWTRGEVETGDVLRGRVRT